jgi:RNA polymerase sigma-70 factor (ECF subfamily)
MHYCDWSDERLLAAYYTTDDEDAFTVLHERHQHRMAGLARYHFKTKWPTGLTAMEEAAEEAVQNTFVKVTQTQRRNASRWNQEKGSVGPWLNTILFRETIEIIRNLGRGESRRAKQLNSDEEDADQMAAQAALGMSPDEAAMLKDCMERLPPTLRDVIVMKHWGGLKQTEIAEQLNVANSTVTGMVEKATGLLHKCLEPDAPSGRSAGCF